MKGFLRARWQRLWGSYHVPSAVSNDVFERLYASYANPARGYHGIHHIADGLNKFDEIAHLLLFKDPTEAAWWTHDRVYDPYRSDNELKSMEMTDYDLRRFGLSGIFRLNTCDRIMATMHTGDAVEIDEQFICDIDLSSFGEPSWAQVCKNTRGLRKEDPKTPDDEFIDSRRKKLTEFLKRDRIYYTQYFQRKYERQARENIMREIEQLPQMLQTTKAG